MPTLGLFLPYSGHLGSSSYKTVSEEVCFSCQFKTVGWWNYQNWDYNQCCPSNSQIYDPIGCGEAERHSSLDGTFSKCMDFINVYFFSFILSI
jgi:hypothetical protein